MFIDLLLIFIGIFLLIKGADFIIQGSIDLSKKVGLSELFIGLTLVSFGTSAPELVVGIVSSVKQSGIVMGNVLGSNISNIGLILGLGLFLKSSNIEKSTIKYELPFLCFVSLITFIFILKTNSINRFQGIVFLILLTIYLVYLFNMALKDKNFKDNLTNDIKKVECNNISNLKITFFIFLGLIMLTFGGEFTVNNSIKIANFLGVSETLIGITIVAVGTSLPELATTIVAIKKNSFGIVIGNLIGSNIFNILIILGISSIINPILPDRNMVFDSVISLLLVLFLIFSILINKNRKLIRKNGLILLVIYIIYISLGIYMR